MRKLLQRLRATDPDPELTRVSIDTAREVIEETQALYLATFKSVLEDYSDQPSVPEALLLDETGQPAVLGASPFPARVDLLLQPEDGPNEMHHIASAQELEHPPLLASPAQGQNLVLNPFTWDCCEVVTPLVEPAVQEVLEPWFVDHFRTHAAEGDLTGAIHYASEVVSLEGLTAFTLDLGTAPTQALMDLIQALWAKGAGTVILRKEVA